jgi:catechol 1,2-dioxygenase
VSLTLSPFQIVSKQTLTVTLSRLVDEITTKKAADAPDAATQSAILGPFFRAHTPLYKMGESISHNTPKDAQVVFMFGKVKDCFTGKALSNASVQVWEASTNGLYSQQDNDQIDYNLHGKFVTGENGEYAFYCLRPTPYPVPNDGPAGKLLELLDRHPYRPAHIHLTVS